MVKQKKNLKKNIKLKNNSSTKIWLVVILVLSVGALAGYRIYKSYAYVGPPTPYSNWTWSNKSALSFENDIQIQEVDPGPRSTYFWSHQFSTTNGSGGYIGLQNLGSRYDGTRGRQAIFSIWDALDSRNGNCHYFTDAQSGEGAFWSCRSNIEWVVGRTYKLKVFTANNIDPSGTWLRGQVVDTQNGNAYNLGDIKIPKHWGGIGDWSVMWTEYFSYANSCDSIPYAKAYFGFPVHDGNKFPNNTWSNTSTSSPCRNVNISKNQFGYEQQIGTRQPALSSNHCANRRNVNGVEVCNFDKKRVTPNSKNICYDRGSPKGPFSDSDKNHLQNVGWTCVRYNTENDGGGDLKQ